ncbi:hypothetical protein DSO57_1019380 [Entomophthora muscae]|uniref:Uncharacterized protein n=1 Tax=Entomophthora muscae TaxID=34485 RepID=A0ACC2ST80_9FUNG|nr:hypothetical protein DSO57_1019380 [Entomophthora muscae]
MVPKGCVNSPTVTTYKLYVPKVKVPIDAPKKCVHKPSVITYKVYKPNNNESILSPSLDLQSGVIYPTIFVAHGFDTQDTKVSTTAEQAISAGKDGDISPPSLNPKDSIIYPNIIVAHEFTPQAAKIPNLKDQPITTNSSGTSQKSDSNTGDLTWLWIIIGSVVGVCVLVEIVFFVMKG